MSLSEWMQTLLYFAVILGLTPVLGGILARILGEKSDAPQRPSGWLERAVYRGAGIDPTFEMSWRQYGAALLAFNVVGVLFVLLLEMLQRRLPLNPADVGNVPFLLAFNTAVSFATNTNWQAYSGEVTMSYLTQMLGLAVQNFLSAATGIAVMVALARGLTRTKSGLLGNFWVDLTRSTLYILLPLSLLLSILLIGQGVVQNFSPPVHAVTLEGKSQVLPMGPAASQIAIKQLGTNGGGFFGVNSEHPFENPTPMSNFLEMVAILLLPAALTDTFGRLVHNRRHGFALLAAMTLIFAAALWTALAAEHGRDPSLGGLPFLEGKETRFGITGSVLWATATTAASNGSVNAMLDSLSPAAGGIAMLNIMLGEVVFGGVGAGIYGMVLFVILAVFIAGLMVGRTPEYLGKKIEGREIRLAVIGVLVPAALILLLSALACILPAGLAGIENRGPHGLTEILYAFSSGAGNNGSAFAGLNADTAFYNTLIAFAMILGRYAVILPVLAIAGGLAGKKTTPPSPGTFPTEGPLFVTLLIFVVLVVGALTFMPALSLGPIMEHFLMTRGRLF